MSKFGKKIRQIAGELRIHAPFTVLGAITGVVFMLLFKNLGQPGAHVLFSIFHPLHVVLSAMVTASLFELHRKVKSFIIVLIIGIVGSIGIATLSDCILPFFGESILGAAIPTHAGLHDHEEHLEPESNHDPKAEHTDHLHDENCQHDHTENENTLHQSEHVHGVNCQHNHAKHALHDQNHNHEHEPSLHLGFIEEWYLVFPSAILGVLIAYFRPSTKYPHAAHVLFSTWASSSHMLMNTQADFTISLLSGMFLVLFLAVWLPCCVSDIIFPMIFVKDNGAHIGTHKCVLCGRKEKEKEQTNNE